MSSTVAISLLSILVTIAAPANGQFSHLLLIPQPTCRLATAFHLELRTAQYSTLTTLLNCSNYNYETSALTEYAVNTNAITSGGYGGTMDEIAFDLAAVPIRTYHVKITYNSATVVGGWDNRLMCFRTMTVCLLINEITIYSIKLRSLDKPGLTFFMDRTS